MENNKNHMPGYDVYEYLLVLSPDKNEYGKIMEVKQQFHAVYKAPSAIYSKPHITLVNFIQFEMLEKIVVNNLETIAANCHSLPVELKDYGNFVPHTIFINVISKDPIVDIVKRIKAKSQGAMTLGKYPPHFSMLPHLTIAKGLDMWQYEQGILEYNQSSFSGTFMAEEMILLKKLAVEGSKYQVVKKFAFNGFHGATTQGNLFASL
ncbi:MAG: 2'-5' RNA ligase family protein [Ferruginibacter sp.]